ncbi:MAG: hypothetical protein AUK48_13060 [Oscillatoriales cyanobacterium CG2_30_44_21]|nr:MAG: hypothetical protein AUK48_13060 [Oscillatoriales cyanobacterium CG2_30_44_21]
MKNKYSQDFDHDADASLVTFLQQNKSPVPAPAPNFEEQLYAEISKYPQRSLMPFRADFSRWLPMILAVPISLGVAIGITYTNRSQYQMANKSTGITELERVEIEKSLISSWSMADDLTISSANGIDSQLLLDLTPLDYE